MPHKFVSMSSSLGNPDSFSQAAQTQYYVPENMLEVEVLNPRTHGTSRSMYTDYEIRIKSNLPLFKSQSSVRRRFSDFLAFREVLTEELPNVSLMELPPKVFHHRFSDKVINERCTKLNQFMRSVASNPLIQTGAPRVLKAFTQEEFWDSDSWLYK